MSRPCPCPAPFLPVAPGKCGWGGSLQSGCGPSSWANHLETWAGLVFEVIIPNCKCSTKHQFCNLCSEPFIGAEGTDVTTSFFWIL